MTDDNFSCVKEVTKVVYLSILPQYSSNALGGVCEILESWKSHYIQQLQGIVVGYKNVSLVSKRGYIKVDNPVIFCAVKATFDLFYPSVGSFVKARINRVSGDSIGCLIHNTINVAINKKLNVVSEASEFIALDRLILFQIIRINLKKKFIHLKGKITDECVKIMRENDIFKSKVVAVQNNELTKFSDNFFNEATSNSSIQSSNETANDDENTQDNSKKAKKRKRESLGDESLHKKKKKTTESDSDKTRDKSPKKKKKSKKDSHEITDEYVGLAIEDNAVKSEVDDFENNELPEFPSNFISPPNVENQLDNEIVNTDMKLPNITQKSKKRKGDSLGVDSVTKKKKKRKENNSDRSKHKSPKKKKKEKPRKDFNDIHVGFNGVRESLGLISKNITLESEANGFDINGLPDFSIPADLENYLGAEAGSSDSKSPDITKKAKKRKRESLGSDSMPKKKRKIDENKSVKTKEKAPKKKKKDKSKKDSKKDRKKKSRDKVISTKKRLHGYKVKLKKNKDKDKDKKSKKRKSKPSNE